MHLPDVHGPAQLGDYYLNRSGMVGMPEEWKGGIQEGMSQLQTIKTAIHEIAHAKLHTIDPNTPEQSNRPDSRTREVQAESVAYAVCQHYGLDTSEYSFGYVAGWSSGRELAELKASLEIIRSAAHELISALDEHLAELRQQREADLSAVQEAAFALDLSLIHI